MCVSQAPKEGYERNIMVCAWWGMGSRLGTLVDVQACWYDSTMHVQRFFPPKVLKQMTVTSLKDVTNVLLMYIGVRYKRITYETRGDFGLESSSVHACTPVSLSGKPQTLHSVTMKSLEEWNYNQKGKCSLFVQL